MYILIDGHHVTAPMQTGLATYSRNLNRIAKDLGNDVSLLSEFPITEKTPPLLAESILYDASETKRDILKYVRDCVSTIPSLVGWRECAHEVRYGDFVVKTGFENRLPVSDRLLTAPWLFSRASIYFAVTGRFMKISAPYKIDIAHWTKPLPIAVRGAKNIYTIHDVIPLKLPYTTRESRIRYYRLIKRVVETADRIVVVSETTRRDVLELFPTAARKIVNTFQAVQLPQVVLDMPTGDLSAQLSRNFGLDFKRYFLFYSAIEPKKNLRRLVKAYAAAETRLPLIVVGRKGWLYEEELASIQYLHAREGLSGAATGRKIVRLDYLAESELTALIRGARAVLFPSIYEGFGLPILEAMICGTPVLTSNLGSMREVATPESAILVNPYDTEDIRRAIEQLSADNDLCTRMSSAGRVRAEAFSWAAYSARMREVYR